MRIVVTLIIIILVILGIYYLVRTPAPTPATSNNTYNSSTNTTNNETGGTSSTAPSSTATTSAANTKPATKVTYTDNGFSPKTITIKKGDAVTFTNDSSVGMWVASNPHPTHTDYPGFDEKASVAKGGSWSFTFERAGSCGYHNHRNPSNTAMIIVQ